MATAASVSITWIPEDDLLLKNAVEAGASLEALAKGAVQFSRRFTFRELRDRWHSLLYDPDVSAQASTRMSELELSGFNPLTKSNRSEQPKGNKEVPQKRKLGSIRKQYYSMRKKFQSEFYNSTDLGFLDETGLHDRSAHGADFQDNFELPDIEILRSALLTGCSNTAEEKHPNGILRKDGFAEGLSSPLRQDGRTSFNSIMQPRGIPSFIKGFSVNFNEHSGVDESSLQQGLEMQHLSVFDSTKDNPQGVFHGLRQDEHSNSPNSNSSFHAIGFPSPQPNLPLWETAEEFSANPLPVILKQGNATHDADKMLTDDGDGRGKDPLVYNGVPARTLLGVRHNGPGTNNSSAVSECEDISYSLLNLEDEIPLIDVDGKETSDKSYCDNLNSLLLSSPNDVREDCVSKLEPETLVVSETCLMEPKSADIETSEAVIQSVHGDHQNVHHPVVEVPSMSVLHPDSHALNDGTMLCTLNTEDPEIPRNDDIFLLIHPSTSFASSAAQPITRDSMDLSSAPNQNQIGEGINSRIKGKDLVRSSSWSQKVGQNILSEARPVHSLVGFGVKSEVPDSNSPISLPGDGNKALSQSSQSQPLHANPSILAGRMFEEDVARVDLKTGEAPVVSVEPRNTEAGCSTIALPESAVNPSILEEEESQSDDDVPYFSDVEAMILEMDLDPHDQESCSTKQGLIFAASKYQYEDSRRTIMRLEQCAQSCLQRAMTSQGSFAIFFGRHLRHYMRKTEVILGRSTDDVDVDIDLRKEGRANKISRRQAIIKMERDGSFHLKNLGKSLISVNGKSVATGQLLNLSSSCLIEIRGMSFVFEINQKYVRRYINSISQQSTMKNNKFDWSPEVDI